MREIKFRVYIRPLQIVCNVIELRNDGSVVTDGYEYALESDAVDLMQFTGLTDVNGVEVYESDVVEETRILAGGKRINNIEVEYIGASFVVGDLKLSNGYFGISYRVIGNKFQNPELLEQSK